MRVKISPRNIAFTVAFYAVLATASAFAQQAVQPGITPADQIIVPVAPSAETNGVTPAQDASVDMAKEAAMPAQNLDQTASVDTGKGQALAPASLVLPTRGPDLEALRYYAKNGEHDRYRREYQRIQALYPGWIAPRDLFADNSAQEQELWDLYGKNDVDAIQRRIAEMRAADPGWQPSQVLLDTISQRKTRGEVAADRKSVV